MGRAQTGKRVWKIIESYLDETEKISSHQLCCLPLYYVLVSVETLTIFNAKFYLLIIFMVGSKLYEDRDLLWILPSCIENCLAHSIYSLSICEEKEEGIKKKQGNEGRKYENFIYVDYQEELYFPLWYVR